MNKINTRKALNPAYRKHKPLRKEVINFTTQLQSCINAIKLSDENGESEEHIKSHFTTFFKTTFYSQNYINTKDRIDLAIYLDDTPKSDVGVIIEAKKPSNKAEFLTQSNLNRKALQELLLYYLRERVDNENNNIKHLIATNGYEWYLFKAEDFYNFFYKNKALIKEYKAFRDGLKDTTKNELFYNEIAKKYIAEVEQDLPFVHLDFSKTNFDKLSDVHLNTLFKIFSNVHLLGQSFGNDSNQLNTTFYNELLHIIGLEEVKDKGKKVISRKSEKDRDYASVLENAIFHLEDRDYLSKVKSVENSTDKAFNVGLELCLTWVNRILFLKLLESQLLAFHKNDSKYKFLNSKFVSDYDELNDLFFSALAKKEDERHPKYKDKYKDIPYLNSSLFERNIIENEAFEVSALSNDESEVYSRTVLKDANGKRLKGKLPTLDYLFRFLDAYDFATDGNEGIAEGQESKSLINASVLGLIFEKINGYKEGSFYTPAYITMYMCKETLRRAVVQKFKEQENDEVETFEDLKIYCRRLFKPDDLKRFNEIINSLRICDPAVGSGHFLVSALNELIVIKNELGILVDAKGLPLSCDIEIVNDELYVSDNNSLLFEYIPNNTESTRIQQTLFHEKQVLIENCLFGVDINPNSVKICRLRLWIELLKNAYYTKENRLQTLPNIDINIKCGNSLISRFSLDDDLKGAFKGKDVNYSFKDYKNAVADYKDANSKERKREVLAIIEEVKNNFKSTLDNTFINKFQKAQGDYINEEERLKNLKAFGEKIKKTEKDNLKKLKKKADDTYLVKEEIVNNAIYHNAFEWRFEFPEILSEDGNYIGFDVVIGNPPWVSLMGKHSSIDDDSVLNYYKTVFPENTYMPNLYEYFVKKSIKLLKGGGFNCFIVPDRLGSNESLGYLREYLLIETKIEEIIYRWDFPDIITDTLTFLLKKEKTQEYIIKVKNNPYSEFVNISNKTYLLQDNFNYKSYKNDRINSLITKLNKNEKLSDFAQATSGFGGKSKLITSERVSDDQIKILKGKSIGKYCIKETLFFEFIDDNITGRTRDVYKLGYKPKLLLRKTGVPIIASIDYEGVYPEQSLYMIYEIDENVNPEFLLALLNSKLFNFFYISELVTNLDSTPQLKNSDLYKFPVIISKEQNKYVKIINQILSLKKYSLEADTIALEKEIDQMVYELYGLTEDEIAIVENS